MEERSGRKIAASTEFTKEELLQRMKGSWAKLDEKTANAETEYAKQKLTKALADQEEAEIKEAREKLARMIT